MGADRRHRRESRQARLAAMASGMRGCAQLVRGEWPLRMSPAYRQDDDGCDGIIAPQYARQSAPPHQDAAVHGAGWYSWLRCQASRKCRVLRRQPWDQESRSGGKAATRRAPALPVSMSPQYKTFLASGKSTLALVTRTTPVLTNGATFLPSMTLISVFTPSAPIE